MKKLNVYLSNLNIGITKLHNLHWNVVGKNFMAVHNFTEELYDEWFEKFDEIAEILKMKNEFPLASVKDYLDNASISEIESKDYSDSEVIDIVLKDIIAMKELAVEIRAEADAADDFTLVAAIEDHIAGYEKNIWMLSAMSK